MDNTTAKIKAKELIEKFKSFDVNVIHTDCEGDAAVATNPMTTMGAKQCALICQQEKINTLSELLQVYPSIDVIIKKEVLIRRAIENN